MSKHAKYQMGVDAWEVGWAHRGHPTLWEKRNALQEALDKFGDTVEKYWEPPQIRHACYCSGDVTDQVGLLNFGRKFTADLPQCAWAVFAVLTYPPAPEDYVPEGARLPRKP